MKRLGKLSEDIPRQSKGINHQSETINVLQV